MGRKKISKGWMGKQTWCEQQKKVLGWWGVGSRTQKVIWNHDIQRAVNARGLTLRGAPTPEMNEIQEAPERRCPGTWIGTVHILPGSRGVC